MKCETCSEKAIFQNPTLCKSHFLEYFEEKVKKTIEEFDLLDKKDKVCIAASGGKDSVTVLYLLNKLGYNVEALAIDEGIEGYRDGTLKTLAEFCKKENIPLRIKSYKEEVGKDIDSMVPEGNPACKVCGTFRRHLLNKYSEDYDKIATGHNLDDESQAVLMNLFKAQIKLFMRQGPKTKEIDGFTQKIKPLYFLKEKEIMAYTVLKKLNTPFNECPYAKLSFRLKVRDLLNSFEKDSPGAKQNVINKYLSLKNDEEVKELEKCRICGYPASGDVCKACKLQKELTTA